MKAPDTSQTPSYFGETVVEVLYSRHNEFRAVIAKRGERIFHIWAEKWDIGDWDFIGRGYWNPLGRDATFTDQIETARELAREKLLATPDGVESTSS